MTVTCKRSLRTGRSLWADSPGLRLPVSLLTKAISVEVAVVGGGISGAFMAHELSRDRSVAVLDRRPPIMGSTVASTALLEWEIDLPLTALAGKIGLPRARRAYLRSFLAVQALRRIVAGEKIRCGLKDMQSLYVAGNCYGHRALRAEVEARRAVGLKSRFLERSELRERYGIDRSGAILSEGSASADPARLAAGLLRRAIRRGTTVYSRVQVLEAIPDPVGVTLITDAGQAVRAEHVVFCCGYEFPKGVSTGGAKVLSTWALASREGTRCPPWMRETILWEASRPYLYVRMGGKSRLIVGGEDESTPSAHLDTARLTMKARRITRKLRRLIPGLEFDPDYCWAGAFGESATGLPVIGPVKGKEHCWAVLGLGGNGITSSVLASQIIAAEIRGRQDPDASLYRP